MCRKEQNKEKPLYTVYVSKRVFIFFKRLLFERERVCAEGAKGEADPLVK